jgi:two-component system, LuxR family, response regulator FixJ
MMSQKLRIEGTIFVVDDDEPVRHSLALLLEAVGLDVEAFASAEDVLTRCQTTRPACVVTDVRMPGMDGLELQQRLSKLHADVPVIVITGHGDVPLAVQAMKAGAVDFIEKPFSDDVILASIESAASTRYVKKTGTVTDVIGKRIGRLTPRELEVFQQLILGHPNKVIAYHLNISARTVEIHRARVMEKMEAKSLPGLVRMAIEAGVEMPG